MTTEDSETSENNNPILLRNVFRSETCLVMEISPDGSCIAAGSFYGNIAFYSTEQKEFPLLHEIPQKKGHPKGVRSLSWHNLKRSSAGKFGSVFLLSCGNDKTVKIWELNNLNKKQQQLEAEEEEEEEMKNQERVMTVARKISFLNEKNNAGADEEDEDEDDDGVFTNKAGSKTPISSHNTFVSCVAWRDQTSFVSADVNGLICVHRFFPQPQEEEEEEGKEKKFCCWKQIRKFCAPSYVKSLCCCYGKYSHIIIAGTQHGKILAFDSSEENTEKNPKVCLWHIDPKMSSGEVGTVVVSEDNKTLAFSVAEKVFFCPLVEMKNEREEKGGGSDYLIAFCEKEGEDGLVVSELGSTAQGMLLNTGQFLMEGKLFACTSSEFLLAFETETGKCVYKWSTIKDPTISLHSQRLYCQRVVRNQESRKFHLLCGFSPRNKSSATIIAIDFPLFKKGWEAARILFQMERFSKDERFREALLIYFVKVRIARFLCSPFHFEPNFDLKAK